MLGAIPRERGPGNQDGVGVEVEEDAAGSALAATADLGSDESDVPFPTSARRGAAVEQVRQGANGRGDLLKRALAVVQRVATSAATRIKCKTCQRSVAA